MNWGRSEKSFEEFFNDKVLGQTGFHGTTINSIILWDAHRCDFGFLDDVAIEVFYKGFNIGALST